MKNIFITGAASGIGRAVAQLFHSKGWSVAITDVSEPQLAELARTLGSERVWSRVLDVTDAKACREAVDAYAGQFDGYLQVLFNCAGILQTGPFEKLSPGTHKRIIDINVGGVMNMCHGAFRALRVTPGAVLVNMSSASALYGTPDFASYSASKFAVRGLTEALNIEWKVHDITVVDIMPPFVKTPMLERHGDSPIVERLGVSLSAEDVAQAVWDECQDDADRVHRPVGLSFKAMMALNKVMPGRVTREALRLLARRR